MSSLSATTAAPDKSSTSPFRLPTSVDQLLVSAVLGAGPPTTVQGGKEPLSLQSTTVNFRRFVQKSGPIFVAQDAVEAVFRWEDPAKTVFFAAVYGFICYRPLLALFIPSLVLISVLLASHQGQERTGTSAEEREGPTEMAKDPPGEGSVDYFANLQNIQITMGRVADLTDTLRSLVPLLTWQNDRLTRALLHASVLFTVLLALAAPFGPWRWVFFLLGEAGFLAGHPLTQSLIAQAQAQNKTSAAAALKQKKHKQLLERLLQDDQLGEEDLEMEVVEVQRLEVESRVPGVGGSAGGNGASAAGGGGGGGGEGWSNEAVVGGELPTGFRWLGKWEEPLIESQASDTDGWTYSHIDGSRNASPTVQGEKGPIWAQSRRRRMVRRAIGNPLLQA
ncbi:hypothetical protein JCM11641_006291 [Rhodosporidiobolus odoratus]